MDLLEHIKTHWIGGVIALAIVCISTTWFAINEVLVRPRDFEIEKQTREISNLQGEAHDLKARLASSEKAELQEEIRDLKIQLANSTKELEFELENSRKKVDTLQIKLTNSKKQLSELESQLAISKEQSKTKISNLQSQLADKNKEVDKLRSKLDSQVFSASQAVQEIEMLEDQLVQAFHNHDEVVFKKLLANDSKLTDSAGQTFDKTKYIATYIASRLLTLKYDFIGKPDVRIYFNIGVATRIYGNYASNTEGNQLVKHQSINVWVKREGRWQVVARQVTDVKS